MRRNKVDAIRWLLRDETGIEARNNLSRLSILQHKAVCGAAKLYELSTEQSELILEKKVWDRCGADDLPSGLDYWMFDLSYRFGKEVANQWLNIVLKAKPEPEITTKVRVILEAELAPLDETIAEMDVLVRRRLKMEKDWVECKHWLTNRANRAKTRAVKLAVGVTDLSGIRQHSA